jgi:RNA polymerase sigma factor (sigma-70 family)
MLLSDEEIIAAIKGGGRGLERAMEFLYLGSNCREKIMKFIYARNGTREDAEDIFQDGIRNLILSIRAGKYRARGSLQNYLLGMCKNLWFKRFQKIMRDDTYQKEQVVDEKYLIDPEAVMMGKEQEDVLNQLLASLGYKCKKVLEMWQLSYSMREIAAELDYSSEGVARKKKRLCMKKLLKILDEKPEVREFLQQYDTKA